MALQGIRVIEMAGLAPVPYCGLILSDFGADVIRVDRSEGRQDDVLARGKRSIAINLKAKEGIATLLKILSSADVLIEPFRPGVMEKLGLGPDVVTKINPKIIYARLTGFGQQGPYAKMAGHDINYVALSGALSAFGRKGENPIFPGNVMADFAGGGMTCALGIALALIERNKSGKGQVIDCAMMDGSAYLATFIYHTRKTPVWDTERGTNILDSGAHFYEVYKTKDGKFLSVGAYEPQFYALLLKGIGLENDTTLPHQMDKTQWPALKEKFTKIFLSKTRDEWMKIFDGTDACVVPVLDMDETHSYHHNAARGVMSEGEFGHTPTPAPRLGRTPGTAKKGNSPIVGQHSTQVLTESGFTAREIEQLLQNGAVVQSGRSRL
eukprot:Phypoly_transcript_09201.p1 GENE.Phypoly_transcript_09201~~Phypoly_transcript_09201.p1  ORF type:complete len:381 (+),score=63.11 Phypoly_transcript_09201:169-1311(+)